MPHIEEAFQALAIQPQQVLLYVCPQSVKDRYAEFSQKLAEANRQIQELLESPPRILQGHLHENLLPLDDPLQRECIAHCYNLLLDQGNLYLLREEGVELENFYDYEGGIGPGVFILKNGLECLQGLADEWNSRQYGHHFGIILQNLRLLAEGNLTHFAVERLKQACEYLQPCIDFALYKAQYDHRIFTAAQAVYAKTPADFRRGDFRFFFAGETDPSVLIPLFGAVERANLWHLFDEEGFLEYEHPNYYGDHPVFRDQVLSQVEGNPIWSMGQLEKIHKEGWEAFVARWLQDNRNIVDRLESYRLLV